MAHNAALFVASWGDIILFMSRLDWDAGNTVVKHELAAGPLHPIQPRGARLRCARAEVLFDNFPGAPDAVEAFREFQATVGERRIFTHPFDGSFYARIGDFTPSADPDHIGATVEFIPDGVFTPVSPASAGATDATGEALVSQAASDLEGAMSSHGIGFPSAKLAGFDFTKPIQFNISENFNQGIGVDVGASANVSAGATASIFGSASASASAAASASAFAFAGVYAAALAEAQASAVASDSGMGSASSFALAYASAAVTADAKASVAAWSSSTDLSFRQVSVDVARLSDSISTMIDVGGFELDIELYLVFRATMLLGESVRTAAIAATSATPSVTVMRVMNRVALLAQAGQLYGGAQAQDRADQIESLNEIATRGWLDPGDYLIPTPDAPATPPIATA